MKFVVPGPKVAATAIGPSTPHGARTAAPPQDDFGLDLPDLDSRGGALGDLFDEAFDAPVGAASAIDRSNPYASPQTASTPPKKRRV